MSNDGFLIQPAEHELHGTLFYSASEYSFGLELDELDDLTRAVGPGGVACLTIGTLQIDIAVDSHRSLFVWGHHAHLGWTTEQIDPGRVAPGRVQIPDLLELTEHGGTRLSAAGSWRTVHDPQSGWIRVSGIQSEQDDDRALIATSTVLGLRNGALNSVWVRPSLTD